MALLLNLDMWVGQLSSERESVHGSGAFSDEFGDKGKYSKCFAGSCTE